MSAVRTVRWSAWLPGLLLVGLLASGCASKKKPSVIRTGDAIEDARASMVEAKPRDRVVWQYRLVSEYMRRSQFEQASRTLDATLPLIGGIITNDKDARRARSLFRSEANKIFIGEPYERVMAYYYRGILYWMNGEPDNARACFRSAQFQDADVEERTYAADYVLLDYLDGFATVKLGGDGSDEFKRAASHTRGTSAPPPYHKPANVLLFLEFGNGPVKYATGAYEEQLRFREGPPGPVRAVLHVGAQQFQLAPYDDLFFQATTRGGRVMDHILGNKARFKDATGTIGMGGLMAGGMLAVSDQPEAAAVVGGLGLISMIASAVTTPKADVRMWDTLPRYLSFAALQLPPGPHEVTIDFTGGTGTIARKVSFNVPDGPRDAVLFVSDQSR